MDVTIENVDSKLLDALKSITKLSPNSKIKITKTKEDELAKALRECKADIRAGKIYKTIDEFHDEVTKSGKI